MAINISNGFDTFNTFVQFAAHRSGAGLKGTAVKATLSFDNRNISAVEVSSASKTSAGWFSRTDNDKSDNDRTRDIFRAAIVKMFGGESKIPPSVVKAMEMENYGHGRPLTARRILLVKAAIDHTDAPLREYEQKFQSNGLKILGQLQPETKAALFSKGYTMAELPNIARAVKAYAKSQNVSEADALKEVTTAGSKANRLASYGGRFLANLDNFKQGLRLLDSFATWYADLRTYKNAHFVNRGGDTLTKLHIDGTVTANEQRRGLEAMIFQHIAVSPSIDLAKEGEAVFGMKKNAAMRFFGRGFHGSVLGTVVNVPPAKRQVLFAAVDAFQPLFRNEADADAKEALGTAAWKIKDPQLFVARCAAHLDELYTLMSKGQLTAKNIVKICFPDIRKPGRCDVKALNAGIADISSRVEAAVGEDNDAGATLRMIGTGCTADEVIKFYKDGTTPPRRPYVTDWSVNLSGYEDGGFKQMRVDLQRTYNYSPIVNGVPDEDAMIVPNDQEQNNIAFPDGTRLACSGRPEHQDNLTQAEARIKALCGDTHTFQADVVASCLSQAGKAQIRHALNANGIFNSEHAVVDMTLSRDAATGAVTIHYTSPASLPLRFCWSTTVNVDGTTVTTPLQIEKPIHQMTIGQAREMVKAAADKYNFGLDKGEFALCAALLAQNAVGLLPSNAKILAQFIVRLPFDERNEAKSRQKVAETAQTLKTARSFDFGDPRVKDVEDAIKTAHSDYIAAEMRKNQFGTSNKPGSENISHAMTLDLARSHISINGQTFSKDAETNFQAIYAAFKKTLPTEKAQKAVSSIMHQGGLGALTATMMHCPFEGEKGTEPVELYNMPGGKLIMQRDMRAERGLYFKALMSSNQSVYHDLAVSPDGNTAVLTMRMESNLQMGGLEDQEDIGFGTMQISQKITIDLRPDVPVVTDVKLSQAINP